MSGASRRIMCEILAGVSSRVGLQQRLGLSAATVSQQIGQMLREGLLLDLEVPAKGGGRLGRPRMLLSPNPRAFAAAGLDFGAGHLRAGLFGADGSLIWWSETTRVWRGAVEALGAARRVLRKLLAVVPPGTPLLGVGIADPGMVETETGRSIGAVHIPGWRNLCLPELLPGCGRRTIVHSSAQMKGLAEMLRGGLQGVREGIYVDLGLGVGAAIILDGGLFYGHRGLAGEFGHLCVNPAGRTCTCGGRGCLETECSGRAIAAAAAGGRERGRRRTAADVARAAREGDPSARAIYDHAGRMLGLALSGVLNFLDPQCVVLGGGVSAAGDLLLKPATRVLSKQALGASRALPSISISKLAASEAGAFGAASAVMLDFLTSKKR